MKKFLYSLMTVVALSASVASCGSDDVEAGPSEADQWLHPYGATDADQALQTRFFSQNGIYLLFNDTLRKQQVATNPDGTPFYDMETIDLNYYMTGQSTSANQVFSYDYLTTDADKQKAVDFVQTKILPALSGDLLPFSLLLVNKIDLWSRAYASYPMTLTNPVVYAGFRCTAISVEGVADMTDAQLNTQRNEILKAIVNSKLSSLPSDTFDEFYAPCSQYYSTYAMYADAEAFFETYPTPMSIGLLDNTVSYYSWGSPYGFPIYNIAAASYDLQDYTNAVFTYSEAEFAEKYGEYPIVMQKFQLLKQIFTGIGIKF